MSSKLKDARWQLADVMAEDDNLDLYDIPGPAQQGYLDAAQSYIEEHGDSDMIEHLAAEFRNGL